MSKISSVKMNSRLFTFFICLLVSVFFWLLMTLSKEHSVTITFPVKYNNFPKDKVISDYLPATIDIQIKGKGFNLLTYQYIKTKDTIVIDLKDAQKINSKNNFYLSTKADFDKIAAQLGSNISILKINPDTIYFTFNKKISKQVPVITKLKITFSSEYQLVDSVKIKPEKITVSGATEVINKIKFVETTPLLLDNVDKSIKVKLPIKKTEYMKFVDLSESEVFATASVAMFAEANLDLPIQIENLPSKYNLKIFPDRVNVKYLVSFDNYEKLSASDFKIAVDYKMIDNASNKIKIQLIKSPKFIKSVKLSPEKVEYILRK